MSFWVAVVVALVAGLLGARYLMGFFHQRRSNEPPLDMGLIPWLGHALHFRNDNVDFLQSMQKKHGDIFTTLIAGQYFTFLMDPLSFSGIVREDQSKLDFMSFAAQLVLRVFRFEASYNTHKMIEVCSVKHLKGEGLVVMTQAMMDALQAVLLQWQETSKEDPKSWKEDGLFHFCYNTVFRAGYLALYGTEPAVLGQPSSSILLLLLWADSGLPSWAVPLSTCVLRQGSWAAMALTPLWPPSAKLGAPS